MPHIYNRCAAAEAIVACGNLHSARELRFRARGSTDSGGCVYSKDQSYQASGGVGANGVIRVNVASGRLSASGSGRFRRRTLAIVERRMLRHLVSVATRRI